MVQFGQMEIGVVSGGTLWMDGGAMYGGAPRVLWEKLCTPDECGRVPLGTNCLLIRTAERFVLVDTGYGSKATAKTRDQYRLEPGLPIADNLRRLGIDPAAIGVVVLTHLHFDHAGGCVGTGPAGEPILTFPNAEFVVQRAEWDDAVAGRLELAGAYDPADFQPLDAAGRVRFVDGEADVAPGVRVRLSGGHTRGHQVVELASAGEEAVYPADLCPFADHLRPLWTTAYEQFPLTTRREKVALLEEAVARHKLVVFDHDSRTQAGFIRTDPKSKFALAEVRPLGW